MAEDLERMKKLRADGIPVVAVLLTGRPLWVNAYLNAADAFVVAWLPGSEGGGIADVLIKSQSDATAYDFTGRLSFDWPANDVNPDDLKLPVAQHLFAYGYGLSYATESSDWVLLDETALDSASVKKDLIF